MSKHLFGLVITPFGKAANNRGENEGNITTLQKLLWKNQEVHTTVSAEAIRWALRYFWQRRDGYDAVNRRWNEETCDHDWQDQTWKPWLSNSEEDRILPTFIDDDVLGFMLPKSAGTDGSDVTEELKKDKKQLDEEYGALTKDAKKSDHGRGVDQRRKDLGKQIDIRIKGKADKRRGALDVTRAISLSPFEGETVFSTTSTKEKKSTSIHITEVHATRYQYGFAITPDKPYMRVPARVLDLIDAVISLSKVGGNQGRFLYDFAPDSFVFRWTDDFAPRFLYGFEMSPDTNVSFPTVLDKVRTGDISPNELYIGGKVVKMLSAAEKELLDNNGNGAFLHEGVKVTAEKLKEQVRKDLGL
jgi:CRISPR-associated protein Cst2